MLTHAKQETEYLRKGIEALTVSVLLRNGRPMRTDEIAEMLPGRRETTNMRVCRCCQQGFMYVVDRSSMSSRGQLYWVTARGRDLVNWWQEHMETDESGY